MKKLIVFALCSALLLTSCQGKNGNSGSSDSGDYVHGVVTSAIGNELILELGEVTTQEGSTSANGEMPSFAEGEMPEPAEGEAPNMPKGEMPSLPQGDMADLADGAMSSLPQGVTATPNIGDTSTATSGDMSTATRESTSTATSGNTSTPPNGTASNGNSNRGQGGMGRGGTTIQRNGQSKTYTINVNTPVYMIMGSRSVETTFSNIKTGDILKLTIENDTVTAVSILGQEASTNASN